MTPLTDRIVAVHLPNDATNIRLRFGKFITWRRPHSGHIEMMHEGKYKYLGICSPKEVGFDCEPYCQRNYYANTFSYNNYSFAGSSLPSKNYTEGFMDCNNSFRSLLHSKGLDVNEYYLIIEKIN